MSKILCSPCAAAPWPEDDCAECAALADQAKADDPSCPACGGSGCVEERHDFGAVETLGCPDCEGTGLAGGTR